MNKVTNEKYCSWLQLEGVRRFKAPFNQATCKTSTDDIIIFRVDKGWTQNHTKSVSDEPSLTLMDDDPRGNTEVCVQVSETNNMVKVREKMKKSN